LKKILVVLICIISLNAKDISSVINTINYQKVLTQEIMKEYSFKGMGNKFSNSKNKLFDKLVEYNKVSKKLASMLSDTKSNQYIKTSNKIWLNINSKFKSMPTKSEVLQLQKETDKILTQLSKIMKVILDKKQNIRDNIISISGYQAVIIERMSALYMMKTWGIDDPKFNFKMRESITFFNNSINKLLDNPKTDEENRKTVKQIILGDNIFKRFIIPLT